MVGLKGYTSLMYAVMHGHLEITKDRQTARTSYDTLETLPSAAGLIAGGKGCCYHQ
jgi:hypothetical protein